MIEPYYNEDGITIYNADCRDVLGQMGAVDLVLTDPPYGIGNFVQVTGNIRGECVKWNDRIPSPEIFGMIRGISRHRIIFGANYFNCFEPDGGAIVWIKNQPMPDFSKADIASCSFHKRVEVYVQTWTNFVNTKKTKHPCERPLSLYAWCLSRYAAKDDIILDPFMGSGTTLVAAKQLGLRAIGIEINEAYCRIAVERLRQRVLNFAEVSA